jgi:hypothetical protein
LDLGIVLPGLQSVEIRQPVDAQHDGLSVHNEVPDMVAPCGFDDPWEAAGPVIAASGDQPDPIALALNEEAVAIPFDLVERVGRPAPPFPWSAGRTQNA